MASTLETLLSIQGATEQLSMYSITEASTEASKKSESVKTQPPKRKPFLDRSGTRNYNMMYRIAHDFHERHNPPRYDAEYWTETAADMMETAAKAGNDPFLEALLAAVYSELARESERLRDEPRAEQEVS